MKKAWTFWPHWKLRLLYQKVFLFDIVQKYHFFKYDERFYIYTFSILILCILIILNKKLKTINL
jgi:hypothetical protein